VTFSSSQARGDCKRDASLCLREETEPKRGLVGVNKERDDGPMSFDGAGSGCTNGDDVADVA